MKKTSILTGAILAAVLAAGSQAYAITPITTWTEATVTLGNPGPEIEGTPYQGTISFSSLVTGGGGTYNGQNLTSATLNVEIADDPAHDFLVYAWVGPYSIPYTTYASQGQYTTTSNPDWLSFSLNSTELAYIETHPTIDFQVEADCHLDAYYLSVTGNTVADGGSTMVLLGGVLTTLGMIKRKMA